MKDNRNVEGFGEVKFKFLDRFMIDVPTKHERISCTLLNDESIIKDDNDIQTIIREIYKNIIINNGNNEIPFGRTSANIMVSNKKSFVVKIY